MTEILKCMPLHSINAEGDNSAGKGVDAAEGNRIYNIQKKERG